MKQIIIYFSICLLKIWKEILAEKMFIAKDQLFNLIDLLVKKPFSFYIYKIPNRN